ncbi:hypothetical protein EK904_011017 [Melospiza melodia maxima]|nr:hypothetical protein EK904_011017 [Melospiza melodia maxima]
MGKKEELRRKQTMKVLVIGLGGVTNGGKTTLAEKLKNMLPNCDIISQDDFFKPESEVETDERGFKLYDVLDALYMDEMVTSIRNWMKSPASSGVVTEEPENTCDNLKNVHILIVEGFLLYNYEPLNELWNRRYFLTLPYEECKRRRRVYQPADTPGYFDGHVWPMYLKYKNELEENASMQVDYLDGTKSQEELLSYVYSDIIQELNKLREESLTLVPLTFLHKTGSNNPLGIPSDCDKIPFHPYYAIKDILGFALILSLLVSLSLFSPNLLGDPENFTPANPLVTPPPVRPKFAFAIL